MSAPEATRTARELEHLLAACFRWIDSTAFATPGVIGQLAGAINEIRYTDHERTPAEIVAAALEAARQEAADMTDLLTKALDRGVALEAALGAQCEDHAGNCCWDWCADCARGRDLKAMAQR